MLLELDDNLIFFKEDTIRTIDLRRQGKDVETLPFLIYSWTFDKELNLKNILQLKPWILKKILNKAIEGYLTITNINDKQLELFIKSTFISDKIIFTGFKEKEIEHLKQCLIAKNNIFDHRGNIINYPEAGGYLDQNAKYMYFLNIYRKVLIGKINEENNKRR
ncbi:hypothetical protein X275_01365 [Marinitoga sp. 1197]|uniref:hypothetical protein n=1 Tax=Marinitoga sp. 1197 TaxID=1428449 RepID=UPI000657E13A|nr:hypothetical protein [Marinitoga sp. 1197]AJW76920.1 hypothetical protein UF08_31 [Marinitoga camini virus 1]KLO24064.1 hypothetical protein X275_01365 [Marinitoga sp. 1197]